MSVPYFAEVATRIANCIKEANHVLVLAHANPDADSVSSLLAIDHFLTAESTAATLVSGQGDIPGTIAYLNATPKIRRLNEIELDNFDLIIFVDCADAERVTPGNFALTEYIRDTQTPVINIDHHVTNREFGSVNLVDAEAAATCEILTLLASQLSIGFTPALATVLLSGIQGDTLGLKTPSTTSRTFHVSGDLKSAGADLDTIVDFMFRVKPYSTIRLWGEVLNRVDRIGALVWAEITPEMLSSSNAASSEGEGIVNFIAGASDARAAALLHKSGDEYRVSLRSRSDDVNVSTLAGLYNGGGHSRAAGCRIKGDSETRNAFLHDIASRLHS